MIQYFLKLKMLSRNFNLYIKFNKNKHKCLEEVLQKCLKMMKGGL